VRLLDRGSADVPRVLQLWAGSFTRLLAALLHTVEVDTSDQHVLEREEAGPEQGAGGDAGAAEAADTDDEEAGEETAGHSLRPERASVERAAPARDWATAESTAYYEVRLVHATSEEVRADVVRLLRALGAACFRAPPTAARASETVQLQRALLRQLGELCGPDAENAAETLYVLCHVVAGATRAAGECSAELKPWAVALSHGVAETGVALLEPLTAAAKAASAAPQRGGLTAQSLLVRVAAELAEWDCKLAAVVGGPRQAARALERLFMTSLYPVLERLGSSSLLVAQAAKATLCRWSRLWTSYDDGQQARFASERRQLAVAVAQQRKSGALVTLDSPIVAALIVDHSDYLVDAMSARLRRLDASLRAQLPPATGSPSTSTSKAAAAVAAAAASFDPER
jgi:hypothetical protein